MIHKFKYDDKYLVLDVNSSNLFEVDQMTCKALEFYPLTNRDEAINKLSELYLDKEAIIECLDEIDSLIKADLLFTKESKVDVSRYRDGAIKAMCLNVSHDCNLACKYCFASGGDFNMAREVMDFETGKKAIDFLIKHSKNRKNLEVDFFGGEPLMNFDVVKKIVTYARSEEKKYNKNFRFTITTNAILLDEEKLQYINENMDNLVMSLDGRKEVNDNVRLTLNKKGSYDLIINNILRASKERERLGKEYYVRGTFTAFATDFSQDVAHLSNLGIKNISIEPVVSEETKAYALKEDHLKSILREYDSLTQLYLKRKNTNKEFNFFHFNVDLDSNTCEYKKISGCGAGCEYVAITPKGDIYPCHQFVGNDSFILGNVDEGIVEDEIRDSFYKASLLDKEECSTCWAKYFCGGGCHANAYNFYKKLDKPYKLGCEMHKKRMECALYIKSKEKENIDYNN